MWAVGYCAESTSANEDTNLDYLKKACAGGRGGTVAVSSEKRKMNNTGMFTTISSSRVSPGGGYQIDKYTSSEMQYWTVPHTLIEGTNYIHISLEMRH